MDNLLSDSLLEVGVSIPPLLYKYANWRNDYHKRLITHREIFFTSPRQFNDPFDSAIPLRYDLMTPEQELVFLKRMVPFEFPHARPDEIEQLAQERFKSRWLGESSNSERVKAMLLEDTYNTTGLFCVSYLPDSLLMWSYYANSHSGFCIGYDAAALSEQLEIRGDLSDLLFDGAPVAYFSEYPVLNPGELDDRQYFLMRTHVKSREWRHEREWRFIVLGATGYSVQLPVGIIRQVILGCRMSDDHKREIITIARETLGPDVTFWQTKTKAAEFGLELVPLS